MQQYDESYCGAYFLYMIYLIERGFRIKNALNILVNQCKYPEIYNECFCLGCTKDLRSSFANNDNYMNNVNDNNNDNDNDNDKDNDNNNDKDNDSVKDIVNDKDNDQRSSFTKNNNDNDNDLRSSSANNDNVNDNDNVIDNDNVKDNFIYLFDEKHQRGIPNNKECLSNNISANINEDLQSWLNDDNIITEATLPENFRCIKSDPSECGQTFLFKKLYLARIYFDKLYIIGPAGYQYEGVESYHRRSCNSVHDKADVEFVKDIKDLPSPDQLPKDLRKIMIFDDARIKEGVINEYFCRGCHNN